MRRLREQARAPNATLETQGSWERGASRSSISLTHRRAPRALLLLATGCLGVLLSRTSSAAPEPTSASANEPLIAPLEPSAPTAESLDESEEPRWFPPAAHAFLLFSAMRSTEAYLWPDPFSYERVSQWPERYREAFTMAPKFDASKGFMRWDGDPWEINVLGHGLLGSELYLRPRRCGFGVLGSLAYATVTSAVWEYGFEANGVRPSGVDLWFTPLSGLLLGETRWWLWNTAGSISSPTTRGIVRALLDPLGEFSTSVVGASC